MIKTAILLAIAPFIIIILGEIIIKKTNINPSKNYFKFVILTSIIPLIILIGLIIKEENHIKNFTYIDEQNIYNHKENDIDKKYKEILPYFDEITILDYNYKAHNINTVYGSYTTNEIQISKTINPNSKKYKRTLLHEYAHHLLETKEFNTPIYNNLVINNEITTRGEMYTDLLAYKLSEEFLNEKFSGNYVFPILYYSPLFKNEKKEVESIIKILKNT